MNGKILAAVLVTQGLSNGIWLKLPAMIIIFGALSFIGLVLSIVEMWDS